MRLGCSEGTGCALFFCLSSGASLLYSSAATGSGPRLWALNWLHWEAGGSWMYRHREMALAAQQSSWVGVARQRIQAGWGECDRTRGAVTPVLFRSLTMARWWKQLFLVELERALAFLLVEVQMSSLEFCRWFFRGLLLPRGLPVSLPEEGQGRLGDRQRLTSRRLQSLHPGRVVRGCRRF